MQIHLPKNSHINFLDFMRRLGYASFVHPKNGLINFQKRVGSDQYPRFHVYINEKGDEKTLTLHLDQKRASYENHNAHNAEYDGGLVDDEFTRIKSALEKI